MDLYPARKSKEPNSRTEPEPWVNIRAAAEHLGVKVSWLYATGDGAGVPVARVGRARRYRLSDIDRYLSATAA